MSSTDLQGRNIKVASTESVPPNGCVGILGGGQLGRMLAMAAAKLGIRVHIYSPEETCPAAEVAAFHTCAAYDDEKMLEQFAKSVDVITYEFENVPAQCVEILTQKGGQVSPGSKALSIAQDRLLEKQFIGELGGQTALYHPVDNVDDLAKGLEITGRPAILKTRRLGYDGKGQTRIGKSEDNLPETWQKAIDFAWQEVGANPSILEAFARFQGEISLIAARSSNGEIAIYDAAENIHKNGILHRSNVPANVGVESLEAARALTEKMLITLDYVGVMGVEFFVMEDGSVWVNEFAPRVHNSGHWTQDACVISQFEQHIRAICGWPLGSPERHSNAMMINLIGSDIEDWLQLSQQDSRNEHSHGCMHLYGKVGAKPGRKMGHVNFLSPRFQTHST